MSFTKSAGLVVAALAVLLFAVPSASAAGACTAANATAAKASKRALVRATLCVLNAERARHRLRPLRLNRQALEGRPAALARDGAPATTSRTTRSSGASFVDRIRGTGYLAGARSWIVGENLACGSGSRSTPRSIGRAWMNSPPHRANILSASFRAIGIGVAYGAPVGGGGGTYATDFGRRS